MTTLQTLWASSATKKDGLKTALTASYSAFYSDGTFVLADATNFPASNAAVSVCSASDPEDVKEVLFGWTRSGNTLSGASRLYGNRILDAGDVVRLGVNSVVYEGIIHSIDEVEQSVDDINSEITGLELALADVSAVAGAYDGLEIGPINSPLIRVHPVHPDYLEAYIPSTLTTKDGGTTYTKDPTGNTNLVPVKLVFRPGSGLVGTDLAGSTLVNSVPWNSAYPLTTAQAGVCTQDALGSGQSACYSLQVNRKAGTIHLVRPLDTPVEQGLIVSTEVATSSAEQLSTTGTTLSILWGVNNISAAPICLTRATNIRYATTAGASVVVKVRVQSANEADQYKPSTILWESDNISVTPTAGSTSYSELPDITIDPALAICPPGTTTWVTIGIESGSGTLYITRGAHNTDKIEIAPQVAPRFLYSKNSTPGNWLLTGEASSKYLLHGKLYGYSQSHPRPLMIDSDGDHRLIAVIGQGGNQVSSSSVYTSANINELWRGSVSAGTNTPFSLFPHCSTMDNEAYKISDVSPLDLYYSGAIEYIPCIGTGKMTTIPVYRVTGDTKTVHVGYLEAPLYENQQAFLRVPRISDINATIEAASGNIVLTALVYNTTKTMNIGVGILLVGRTDNRWEMINLYA